MTTITSDDPIAGEIAHRAPCSAASEARADEHEAQVAYDALAPAYDLLTGEYGHDRWLDALEALALEHGLRGRRLLDVACGTGSSFLPMLARGYSVTGCDGSPEMVLRAREKAGGRARLFAADMRSLPVYGSFDLITCLDDALNHLLEPDDVAAALAGMRANLAPDGLLIFDVNTFAAYRSVGDLIGGDEDHVVAWRGRRAGISEPGEQAEVVIDLFDHVAEDLWRRTRCRHRHRHYPLDQIVELVAAAGLEPVATRGQLPGARLEPEADEERHPKVVFVVRRA